jgi:hypothetical protein
VSGSDYSRLTMPMLWALAAGEDPKAVWQQVSAWRMAYEAAELQAGRLGTHRDSLARVWRGPAADAYLAELDRQVESLTRVGEVALANERQAQAVAFSVTETRQKVDELYQQWKAMHDAAGPRGQMGTWRQQESVTEQARAVMQAHADTVVQASRNLVPAQRYDVKPQGGRDWEVLEPPVERLGARSFIAGQGNGKPGQDLPVNEEPPGGLRPALSGRLATPSTLVRERPTTDINGLADLPAGQGEVVPRVGRWVESNTGRAIAPAVIGEAPSQVPQSRRSSVGTSPISERGAARSDGVANEHLPLRGSPQSPERVMPGMPFGAVGGGTPRATSPGRPRSQASTPGRVIGSRQVEGDVHVTPDGHTFTLSTSERAVPVVGEVGWSRRLHAEVDPDDPWAVARGVPPVLAPGPEPTHDPGPGVIGIDR